MVDTPTGSIYICVLVERPIKATHMTDHSSSPPSETRETLLESALLCFAKYGYEATSIRLVASMAGKNSSLIAYHFGNKEGLYRQVIEHLLSRLPKPMTTMEVGEDTPSEMNPRTRLHQYIKGLVAHLDDSFAQVNIKCSAARRLWLSEIQHPKPEVRELLQSHLKDSIQELRGVLSAIRPDLDAGEIAFWGVIIQGCCLAHAFTFEFNRLVWPELVFSPEPNELTERLTNFVFNGLTPPDPAAQIIPTAFCQEKT